MPKMVMIGRLARAKLNNVKKETMLIDIHTHMINGKDLDSLVGICGGPMKKAIEASRAFSSKRPQAMDVASRVAQMDRFGIDYQLATPMPSLDPNRLALDPATEVRACRAINDSMARITEQSKGRVLCAASVPFSDLKEGVKEMERAVRGLGLKGFGVITNVNGKPLDAPGFRAFWTKAAELDVPVFLHPADPVRTDNRSYEVDYDLIVAFGWPFETTLALSRLVFSGVMEELGNLKIVSHHLGGMIPFYFGRIEEHYAPEFAPRTGVAVKRSFKEYFSKFFYDTAVGNNPGAIRCSYDLFGADQLVYATDAPFGAGNGDERQEAYPRIIKALGLPEKDTSKILGENARRLLRI